MVTMMNLATTMGRILMVMGDGDDGGGGVDNAAHLSQLARLLLGALDRGATHRWQKDGSAPHATVQQAIGDSCQGCTHACTLRGERGL